MMTMPINRPPGCLCRRFHLAAHIVLVCALWLAGGAAAVSASKPDDMSPGLRSFLNDQSVNPEKLVGEALSRRPNHPRLYVTADTWDRLRSLKDKSPWKEELDNFRASMKKRVAGVDYQKEYPATTGNAMPELRPVGDLIAASAFLYKMDQSPEWLEANQKLIRRVLALPAWGVGRRGEKNWDLAYAHIAHGLAVAYDWLEDELPEDLRRQIRENLAERSAGQILPDLRTEPYRGFQNNHLSNVLRARMAVGLALAGEEPVAGPLLESAVLLGNVVFHALSKSDGFLAEGTPYWQYNLSALVPLAVLAKENLGIDWFADNGGLRTASRFAASMMLPLSQRVFQAGTPQETLLSFGDGPRHDFSYQYAGYMPQLAVKYHDELAQWVSEDCRRTITTHGSPLRFLGMIWQDESIPATPLPANKPVIENFPDQGIVVRRDGRGEAESVLAIKAGPPAGHFSNEFFNLNPSTSHSQPDAGTLLLYAQGLWVLSPPDYAFKETAFTNSLLINGRGQRGSGKTWLHDHSYFREKLGAKITGVELDPRKPFWVEADLTSAYPREAGLESLRRTVFAIGDSAWLIRDEIALQAPGNFTLLFHGENQPDVLEPRRAVFFRRTAKIQMESFMQSEPSGVGLAYRAVSQPIENKAAKQDLRHINAVTASPLADVSRATVYTLVQVVPQGQFAWRLKEGGNGGVMLVNETSSPSSDAKGDSK